jgi:hypothetical protein
MAGAPGFEPGLSVLETDVLAVDTMPLQPTRNPRGPHIIKIISLLYEEDAFGKTDSTFSFPTDRDHFSCFSLLNNFGACNPRTLEK